MPTPVTDPAILAQLNGNAGQPVTDPAVLAQLNGKPVSGSALDAGIRSAANGATFNLADLIAAAGDAAIPLDAGSSTAGTWMDRFRENRANQHGRTSADESAHPVASLAGGFAGGFLNPVTRALPVVRSFGGAALQGAGIGAAYGAGAGVSNGEDVGGVATDAGIGGVTGGLFGAGFHGLGKVVKGASRSPESLKLNGAGIPLTVGQELGGGFARAEEKLSSLPMVGDAIREAQDRGTAGLNRAVLNRALAPVGESLPTSVPIGREAIDYVGSKLGEKYDALLPSLSAQSDAQFVKDMQAVIQQAKGKLPDTHFGQFSKIVQSQLAEKGASGALDGPTLQGINSELGGLSSGYRADPSFDNRQLGEAIGNVKTALSDLVQRSNPDRASELKSVDKAWANFVRARRAASMQGASDGVFSAPQLASAVRASDKSVGKGAYARGSAMLQDLSDPAKAILAPRVPNSGTADRLFLAEALKKPWAIAPGLAASALYSAPGQAAAKAALFGAPQTRAALVRGAGATAPGLYGLFGSAAPAALAYKP